MTRYPDLPTIAPVIDAGDAAVLPLDGTEHVRATPQAERRRTGRVDTPEHVARFVLGLAGLSDAGVRSPTVLDPACGAGVFLVEAMNNSRRGSPGTARSS